jgi:hypothetical protein
MVRVGVVAGSAALLCTLAFAAFAAAQSISLEVGNLSLSFSATVGPKALPRAQRAPVSLSLSSRFATKDGSQPPPISGATIDIDRALAVDAGGVPSCTAGQLENQTTEAVEAACGAAIVGSGSARIEIAQPGGAPFLAESRLLAVNGGSAGRTTTILIHAYLSSPKPEAIVVPVTLTRLPKGSLGLRARVAVPTIASGAGSLASFDLTLAKRIYSDGGRKHGYLMAKCTDSNIVFEAEVTFVDGNLARGTLVRSCVPRGQPAAQPPASPASKPRR